MVQTVYGRKTRISDGPAYYTGLFAYGIGGTEKRDTKLTTN
jgi:hypothetical protein